MLALGQVGRRFPQLFPFNLGISAPKRNTLDRPQKTLSFGASNYFLLKLECR